MARPKDLGTALESWLVKEVNSLLLSNLHAERIAEGGPKDVGDVRITTKAGEPWVIECKAREVLNVTRGLAKARKKNPGGRTALLWKRIVKPKGDQKIRQPDGERYVIVLSLGDFLELLEMDR